MSDAKIETMVMITGREYEALRAENERLRAVLEMFACNCEGDDICFNIDNCRNYTARAALTQPTENPND